MMADTIPAHSQASARTPTLSRPLCAICNHRYSIYTCPRCALRTCSLPCSTTHKSHNACTGERDRAKWVPMNEYGWGNMMDDYVFLEDIGRKVGEWGRDIGKGGLLQRAGRGKDDGMGRGKGRGRGGKADRGGGRKTKRDILKMQLDLQDIDMELLPDGMERRKANQSIWDIKNKTALLSIEFKFHPPRNLCIAAHPPDQPFTLLTHRNNIETSLLSLLQMHIVDRVKSKNAIPDWVYELVCQNPDDPESFIPPQCLMHVQLDPLSSVNIPGIGSKNGFHRLDLSQKLSSLLRNRQFVEFPTIEICDVDTFRGVIVDAGGSVLHESTVDEERQPKRRKLDKRAGKKAISGLLGGYGSEDDEEGGEQVVSVMDMLGGYAESEDDGLSDADADGETDEEVDVEYDPVALIELMRRVQGRVVDEDQVDWGDSDNEPD